MADPASPPAGWYPDPADTNNGKQRWWDGKAWTHELQDAPKPDAPPAPATPAPAPVAAPAQAAPAAASASVATPTPEPAKPAERKIPLFGARKAAQNLQAELDAAQASLQALGGLDHAQIQVAIDEQRNLLSKLIAETAQQQALLEAAKQQIVATEDIQVLQEVGVYEYRHPLSDAAAYQGTLKQLQDRIKAMARPDGGAVTGATGWTVNGDRASPSGCSGPRLRLVPGCPGSACRAS